jgi:uncharacterized protein YkwD
VRTTDRVLTVAVAGLALALLLALAVARSGPTTTGPHRAAAAAMVDLVNDERARHDLPPFASADDVARVAELWSAEMAATHAMEHNPDHPAQICCWSAVAENVAYAQPHRIWRPGDATLALTAELHEGLLGSPSHRANLLSAELDEIGIGVHVHTDGSVWITQNFRRRQG